MAVSLEHWIAVGVILLVSSCKGHPNPGARPGLFDLFTGNDGGDQEQGRSLQPSFPSIIPNSFNPLNHMADYDDSNQQPDSNQPTNINLVSLFPQNNNVPVTRTGLDPETREQLSEQKEKLEEVLKKLQEMNKQKEEQRQQGNGNFNNNPNLNRPNKGQGFINNPNFNRPNNGNNIFNQGLRPTLRPAITTNAPVTERTVPTEGPALGPKRVWRKLMTKKYIFQAKPVKPENEEQNVPDTLYYVVEQ